MYLAGMTGNGDVVVVDEQLDPEIAGHGIAGGLGVVAFHLRTVAAEHHQDLRRVGLGDPVDVAPQVPQPAGGEEDAAGVIALRMPNSSHWPYSR